MSDSKTLSIEGRVVNHDEEFNGRVEINTETGLIESVCPATGSADLTLGGLLIFSGFTDLHVHAREDASGTQNYKEDFLTMSEAGIQGGVVQVAEMPNNPIAPVDEEKYRAKQKLAEKSLIDVTLYGGIGPGTSPLPFPVPYKAFMGPSVGDLYFKSQKELEEAISRYRGENVSFHCEDPEILEKAKSNLTHESRRPREAEITATDFAISLIEKYDLRGKLCHYSTKDGLPKIESAKKRGVPLTVEVTPHHLYFDESMLTKENALWLQMNPPLRTKEDRYALIEALRSGLIDHIATDHAPHTREEKLKGTSGVPLLDIYGPFVTWLIKEHNFSPKDIARVSSYNPGEFLNPYLSKKYGKGFGKIEEGYVGSLTVIHPDSPITITKDILRTKCAWSPFEGLTFPGRVKYTIVRGKVYPL